MGSKRGAVELSMSMLVIIIISMVVLAGGIALLFKFTAKAEGIKGELDAQTREELDRLLIDEGQQVALPRHRAVIQRGDSYIFGLGILNTKRFPSQFIIEVEVDSLVGRENQVIDLSSQKETIERTWLLYVPDPFSLQQGEHTTYKILVSIPPDAGEGTYIFNVRVKSDGTQYGNTQKMYVTAT